MTPIEWAILIAVLLFVLLLAGIPATYYYTKHKMEQEFKMRKWSYVRVFVQADVHSDILARSYPYWLELEEATLVPSQVGYVQREERGANRPDPDATLNMRWMGFMVPGSVVTGKFKSQSFAVPSTLFVDLHFNAATGEAHYVSYESKEDAAEAESVKLW